MTQRERAAFGEQRLLGHLAWVNTGRSFDGVRATVLQAMLDMIQDDLAQLDIRHDVFFSERSLSEGPRDEVAERSWTLRVRNYISGCCWWYWRHWRCKRFPGWHS